MSGANVALSSDRVQRPARRVAASAWGERGLRAGMAARGVVFLVLAYLVLRVALGALGNPSTSKPASLTGVPQALAAQPGGRVALVVLAVGLLLYALFSLADAILHHNDETPAAKRWGDRLLSLWGFVMYGLLTAYCVHAAFSSSGGHRTAGQQDRQKVLWSSQVLRWPGGEVWLGLAGAVLLVMCGFLILRAARRTFRPRLERDRMSTRAWRAAVALGAAGYLGRALLFGIVGGCIFAAAVEDNPRDGQGVDGSVRIIAANGFGAAFLIVLALLLLTYGVYLFFETRYRRVG